MRIILFSGKGGSGVTTIAAATAATIAGSGTPTLAFGLSPGLGRALDAQLSLEPVPVAASLWAAEGHHGLTEGDEFRRWLTDLMDWRGMEAGLAEDLAALPGLNAAGRLLNLERCAAGGAFQTIVVDCGALDHFLDLPGALDAAARWLERLFASRQQNVLEPFFRVFAAEYASTGDDVLERGQELLGCLASLRERLVDAHQASVRLVTRSEPHATDDAQHAVGALALYSWPVDAIVVNRLLPDSLQDAFFHERRQRQQAQLSEVESGLAPVPVFPVPVDPADPVGVERLRDLAADLYGDRDPADVFRVPAVHSLLRRDGRYIFSLPLPFAEREQMRLEQMEEAIVVHLNGRRCIFPLPPEARYHEATSWSLSDGVLQVTLEI